MLLLTVIRSNGRCSGHRTQFNRWVQSKVHRLVRALYKQTLTVKFNHFQKPATGCRLPPRKTAMK
jgi:hypothetical protein